MGPANEAPVIIEGFQTTALVDTRVQVSAIARDFCKHLGLPISKLKRMIQFEGTGGITGTLLWLLSCQFENPRYRKL